MSDAAKLAQWRSFLGKNRLEAPVLETVVEELRHWFALPLAEARQQKGVS